MAQAKSSEPDVREESGCADRCAAEGAEPATSRGPSREERDLRCAPDTAAVGEGQRLGAEPLEAFLSRRKRFAVAFSGGCDSAYLLAAAKDAGCDVAAYLVRTAFQPAFELDDARRVAAMLEVPFAVVEADVLAEADICANPADRCRLCKRFIFANVRRAAERDGYHVLADGTNGSDDPRRRPGFLSLAEAGVLSPLRRASMTKAGVREASARLESKLGLGAGSLLSDKPSFPCLAAFLGDGAPIDEGALRRVAAERGVVFGR